MNKRVLVIIAIVVIAIIVAEVVACIGIVSLLRQRRGDPAASTEQGISAEYERWREWVFTTEPEIVGMSKTDSDTVYGVIMDIGLIDQQTSTNWAMSLIALPTGEASFHASPGVSVSNLGNNPDVAQAAKEIVQMAQALWEETSPALDHDLPEPGFVRFYFLTTSGVRVYEGHLNDIQEPDSPFKGMLDRFWTIRESADQLVGVMQPFIRFLRWIGLPKERQ